MQRAAQPPGVEPGEVLRQYYGSLLQQFGPQRWWPARTRLEVILGAILTQNTAWRNVEIAIRLLDKSGLLQWERLRESSPAAIEACIRPAGYFRQKTRTIQTFVKWLDQTHQGSLRKLFARPPHRLRNQLLALRGLGPETVDTILLYAGKKPFFVADAYTRRILERHNLIPPLSDYSDAQQFLHRHLPHDETLFNEFHALLVETGKRYCKRRAPECEGCALQKFLPFGRPVHGIRESESPRTRQTPARKQARAITHG